jgi:hypothetical protein
MQGRNDDAGARSRVVVFRKSKYHDIAAEWVLALTAECERCMWLHELARVETERPVLAASLGGMVSFARRLPV